MNKWKNNSTDEFHLFAECTTSGSEWISFVCKTFTRKVFFPMKDETWCLTQTQRDKVDRKSNFFRVTLCQKISWTSSDHKLNFSIHSTKLFISHSIERKIDLSMLSRKNICDSLLKNITKTFSYSHVRWFSFKRNVFLAAFEKKQTRWRRAQETSSNVRLYYIVRLTNGSCLVHWSAAQAIVECDFQVELKLMKRLTIFIVMPPNFHELGGRQFLQLSRFWITILAHEILGFLDADTFWCFHIFHVWISLLIVTKLLQTVIALTPVSFFYADSLWRDDIKTRTIICK